MGSAVFLFSVIRLHRRAVLGGNSLRGLSEGPVPRNPGRLSLLAQEAWENE